MSPLLEQVENAIQTRRLFLPGDTILVAVSGGLDSMVLLHVLHRLSTTHKWRLAVGHLNHRLRGRSSAADERLVRGEAERLRIPGIVERADVSGHARRHRVSLEMAARELRHDFLARAARRFKASKIALAHHADDQVELFFLRLLRGSGTEALGGMKWRSPSPARSELTLVRPLLEFPKSVLREFALAEKVRFREDASNICLDMQRNRLRHELLPLLRRKYQPGLDRIVLRVMDFVAADAAVITDFARHWLEAARENLEPGSSKAAKAENKNSYVAFADLPTAIQRRCLQLQLIELGVAPDYDLIERLRLVSGRLVSVSPATRFGVASGLAATSIRTGLHRNVDPQASDSLKTSALCYRDECGIVHIEQGQREVAFNGDVLDFDAGSRAGQVTFAGLQINWTMRNSRGKALPERTSCQEHFDADLVGSRIRLRHWQPGDRFQPIGMSQSVKLQDLFTNQKVPHAKRRQLVVATTGQGEVFWVENQRISERFKLSQETIRRLQWRWQRP